jgi:hypothetical protein
MVDIFYRDDLKQISAVIYRSSLTHFLILYKVCSSVYMRRRNFACLCCYIGLSIAVTMLRDVNDSNCVIAKCILVAVCESDSL